VGISLLQFAQARSPGLPGASAALGGGAGTVTAGAGGAAGRRAGAEAIAGVVPTGGAPRAAGEAGARADEVGPEGRPMEAPGGAARAGAAGATGAEGSASSSYPASSGDAGPVTRGAVMPARVAADCWSFHWLNEV
jgi:hypothetical protein